MSSKPKQNRTKQYLMLLTVAGLIAIVGGAGSGTFASFNAEVSNTGNYFATGTLVLNDKGGTTTCTSAADSANANNLSTNGCDTLFQVGPVTSVTGTLTAALSDSVDTTELDFSGLSGGSIDAGDTLTVDDGNGHTDTFTAAAGADASDTSVLVTAKTANFAFPDTTTTITDATSTTYAKLTLTNAGTLPANGIKFDVPTTCATTYNEGESTGLTAGHTLTSGTSVASLTFAALTIGGFTSGDPIVVHEGSHSQTFIASSTVAVGATTVNVHPQDANYSYTTAATVTGPEFPTAGELCTPLKLSIVETDLSFDHDSGNAAEGCAYGTTATLDALTAGLGCNLSSGTALLSVPGSPTALKLKSGASSNTGTQLSPGQSRYFLVAVKQTSTSLDNTYQNRKAKFDLLWHIDQA
jgi:hypothetical protein